MTNVEQDISAVDEFISAFAGRDMALREVNDLPHVEGPLVVTTYVESSHPDAPVVTVAVSSAGELDYVDLASQAVLGVRPDLEAGSPLAVDSLDGAGTELPGPGVAHLFEITSGDVAIGMAIVRADRRRGDGETPVAATSDQAVSPASPRAGQDLSLLGEVKLEVAVELGRQTVTLAHMLGLTVGSVVELDRAAGAPVDIRINGLLYGHGEVVVVNDQYAVRIIEIVENPGI